FQQMEGSEAIGNPFNRALKGERATALSILDAPQKYLQKLSGPGAAAMMKPEERDKWIAALQNAGNFKAELEFYESTFTELMASRATPFPDRLKTDGFIRDRTREARGAGMAINDLLMPGRVGTAAKEAECLAL